MEWFMQFGQNTLYACMGNGTVRICDWKCIQNLFRGKCNWFEVKMMHIFQMDIFLPKIQINSHEK
jgi:hypothetical protein